MSLKSYIINNRRDIGAVVGITGFFTMLSFPAMAIMSGEGNITVVLILTFIGVFMFLIAFFIDDSPTSYI